VLLLMLLMLPERRDQPSRATLLGSNPSKLLRASLPVLLLPMLPAAAAGDAVSPAAAAAARLAAAAVGAVSLRN
jgi:hypothetical protein